MPDRNEHGGGRNPGVPSRRSVLRVAAGAGAAGLAATALGTSALGTSALGSSALGSTAAGAAETGGGQPGPGAQDKPAGTDPLVLHVRDAATGEIDVFHGTTQTRVHDRDLAARIVRASR